MKRVDKPFNLVLDAVDALTDVRRCILPIPPRAVPQVAAVNPLPCDVCACALSDWCGRIESEE